MLITRQTVNRTVVFALVICSLGVAPGKVQRIGDLPYASDSAYKHRLDLYLPADRGDAPLVVFVHGGAFMQGDRSDVAAVGAAFAAQGLATAVVSYRLYPDANVEGSTQDVALAVAWLLRNAAAYGLRGDRVILVGHSAGAQIVALLGTNGQFLRAAGTDLHAIAGVFAVSGAYDLRDLSDEPDSWQRVDGHIYGETPRDRARVSPSQHIDPDTPPTEIACGSEEDNPGSCDRAAYFERKLLAAGVWTHLIRENGASHMGMLRALIDPRDPLNEELHDFIDRLEKR